MSICLSSIRSIQQIWTKIHRDGIPRIESATAPRPKRGTTQHIFSKPSETSDHTTDSIILGRTLSDLNRLRGVFESNREKLAAVRAALKELHRSRSARNLRKLEKKVARLQGPLNAAGIDSDPHTIVGMRKEIPT